MKYILLLTFSLFCGAFSYGDDVSIKEVEFDSHGVKLSGSIVIPKNREVQSAVVFVHGSGKQTRNLYWARRFAAEGIAALVYDKRGAGRSGGEYEGDQSVSEKNIELLTDDSIAALKTLRQNFKTRSMPIGLTGISQAGWIVPLAAKKSKLVDYIVLWSGPVCKVSEEDIFSKYTSDRDEKVVPSYETALKSRTEKYIWPDFLGRDTDSSEDLAALHIPGFWIFGESDGSIPVDLSIKNLQSLRSVGHNYNFALFSGLGHNNMEETFATATDWINRFSMGFQGGELKTNKY